MAAIGSINLLSAGWCFPASFEMDPVKDIAIGGLSIALFSSGEVLMQKPRSLQQLPDERGISGFDQVFMYRYNHSQDIASDVTVALAALSPLSCLGNKSLKPLMALGVMYCESILLTFGIDNTLKAELPRFRPYAYFKNTPMSLAEADDRFRSFPSSHVAIAFAGASFVSFIFSQDFPSSRLKIPVIAGSFALAGATATLRVGSGNHFATDVLAGAVIGTACGIAVPWLHMRDNPSQDKRNTPVAYSFSVGSDGQSMTLVMHF